MRSAVSPLCTHILQPLDDVPYAALKKRYQKEVIASKKVQETGPSAVTDKCKSRVEVGPLMLHTYLLFDICVGTLNSFLLDFYVGYGKRVTKRILRQVGKQL